MDFFLAFIYPISWSFFEVHYHIAMYQGDGLVVYIM